MRNNAGIVKAIILAAGYSKRMKSKLPKQLKKIVKKPLLCHTLDVFESCKAIDNIIVVVPKKYTSKFRGLIKKYRYKKVEQLVLGGARRQQSVFNALRKIKRCDYVVIHDGVRPLVTEAIILKIIKTVKRFNAVTCAVEAVDTIVQARKDSIDSFLYRNRLRHIQTPQAFKFDLILRAHQKAKIKRIINASDDAQLVLGLKKRVKLIEGSYKNIKITTMTDLLLLKKLKRMRG